MPKRVQRQRAKGWRMPENTVSIARPSIWGNPFQLRCAQTNDLRRMIVEKYRLALCGGSSVEDRLILERWFRDHAWVGGIDSRSPEMYLRGKNLACWCPLDRPCHAEVLLELANA